MKLRYKKKAIKQLKKLPKRERLKVVRKLEMLRAKPTLGKSLMGEYRGMRSAKAWPYRILYQVGKKTVMMISVVHRQGAYN